MKMKEFRPPGARVPGALLDPPMFKQPTKLPSE